MAKHNEIGALGEKIARDFLAEKGYQILESNWRYRHAEVDIILKTPDNILVFVEVKTRTSHFFGDPLESITDHKKQLLSRAAAAYMSQIDHNWEVRFDFISVIYSEYSPPQIAHYEDTFFPGLF